MGAAGSSALPSCLPTPCSEQKQQAQLQSSLNAEEQRRAEAQGRLEQATRAMQTLKEGLEHLAGKLNHITVDSQVPEEAPLRTSQDLSWSFCPIAHWKEPTPYPIQDLRSPATRESLTHVPGGTPLLLKWLNTSKT